MKKLFFLAAICVLSGFALSGCASDEAPRSFGTAIYGNSRLGKKLIADYGCGSCHIIPGIPNARGLVGPPLNFFSERTMIAGEVPNLPDNLIRWVKDPLSIEPKTAMPNVGLSEAQARDVAAYLYTLR